MKKTSKFGGSSLANAKRMINVAEIIKSDKDRRYIVVSAPGVREEGDTKITDLLYRCAICNDTCGFAFETVETRLREIIDDLEIDFNLSYEIAKIKQNILGGADTDYIVSRGEYLTAMIFAKFLSFDFVDAADIIKFTDGEFDAMLTKQLATKRLDAIKYAVIPGFYGSTESGTIKTFSRGGSDYTGGIIADATSSDLYENWTDVSGFRATDPKIIRHAKRIKQLSYDELYSLASMGASVLHPSSVLPLRERGIELVIKNTFDPIAQGTKITQNSDRRKELLAGISVKKNCCIITYKSKENIPLKASNLRQILGLLDTVGNKPEFVSSDLEGIKLVLNSELGDEEWDYLNSKHEKYRISQKRINLLTLVGYKGNNLFSKAALAVEKSTVLSFVSYGTDKNGGTSDLVIGVPSESNIETVLTALYNEFFGDN